MPQILGVIVRIGSCSRLLSILSMLALFVQVAQFSFALPPAEQMGELLPWMQAAMHMVDLLGSYKLKPDQKVPPLVSSC